VVDIGVPLLGGFFELIAHLKSPQYVRKVALWVFR